MANAQLSLLDNTFGVNGILRYQPTIDSSNLSGAVTIIPLPDGRFIAVGHHGGQTGKIYAARFGNNGMIDTTFGTNGLTQIAINNSIYSYCNDAILQPDGKILLAAQFRNTQSASYSLMAVIRLTADGFPDSTYSSDGIDTLRIVFNQHNSSSIGLQSNGKIILGGDLNLGSPYHFVMVAARFNANGGIDSTFGGQGYGYKILGNAPQTYINSMAIQDDDKIVFVGEAGGSSSGGGIYRFFTVRLNVNGDLDSSFSNDGQIYQSFSSNDHDLGSGVAIQQPGNKIIVSGTTDAFGANDFVVFRYDSLGNLDSGFGNSGVSSLDFSGSLSQDYCTSMALQPDGKLLLGGRTDFTGNSFALARFDHDGNLDAGFGNNGKVVIGANPQIPFISNYSDCNSIALDVNNKIMMGYYIFQDSLFAILRFSNFPGLNVDESKVNGEFMIYPNPASENINILVTGEIRKGEKWELTIYNLTGQKIFNEIYDAQNVISLHVKNKLKCGVYLVKLDCDYMSYGAKLIIE